ALKDGKLVENGNWENIITEDSLSKLYEMNFNIREVNNQRICIYF
ncbi:iron ABC transporter ATP-binding protein, partial [Clostridium perfringens]|nr:iron ABC transporter ATP-binding protein [Clostridium perfringens]